MNTIDINKSYPDWLKEVKARVRAARVKVALAANSELLSFYWDTIFHRAGGKIPWRHHVEIFTKAKTLHEVHFYNRNFARKFKIQFAHY